MARLLFEKTGNAVWISHLDLMRLFQRAFKRAGLSLKHTQGFNPRPSVSIALPLSVGTESRCELLDFELEGERVPSKEIQNRLNQVLVKGIKVLRVYDDGRKIRDLSLLECTVTLEYDSGADETTVSQIRELFSRETLTVTKKSKNGPVAQDILPLIRKLEAVLEDSNTVILHGLICCQNPSLNPALLVSAVETYLEKPNHARCGRIEIYDTNEEIFR